MHSTIDPVRTNPMSTSLVVGHMARSRRYCQRCRVHHPNKIHMHKLVFQIGSIQPIAIRVDVHLPLRRPCLFTFQKKQPVYVYIKYI